MIRSVEPPELLLQQATETQEAFTARIGGLPPLRLGTARLLAGRYDQDSKVMPIEIRIDDWAKEHAFGGPYELILDADQVELLTASEGELPVTGRFELKDGFAHCTSVAVATSAGDFTPALDLSDPWVLFQKGEAESLEELAYRVHTASPLPLGAAKPMFENYDAAALALPVKLQLIPWAEPFAPKRRLSLKLKPAEVKVLSESSMEPELWGDFQAEGTTITCTRFTVVVPSGSFAAEAVPPSIPDLSLSAQGLWETTIRIGEAPLPLAQVPSATFAREANLVTLGQDFWLGKYPVTQRQYLAIMGSNPSNCRKAGLDAPVEGVSWTDAQEFIARLNKMQSTFTFRLPTEAEWEYACRAGADNNAYGPLDSIAWHLGNSARATHPVGQKEPNDFGLYDMLGNVMQWCQDWYGDYPKGSLTDPQGPAAGLCRVFRGGAWNSSPWTIRADTRSFQTPNRRLDNVGLRLAALPRSR